jgi:membrane protease YdiL (CAAX protease family)
MSARAEAPRRTAASAASLVLVALGCALLVLRTRLLVLPDVDRVAWLAVLYGGLLAAALLVPLPSGRRRAHPALVLVIGLSSVGAAAWAAGRPAPYAFAAWALPLAILAAVAEEALFRRVAYGVLEPYGAPTAVVVTAIAFGLIHIPLYGVAAFPVDLGAGLLFGWQRWAAGTWTAPATTHAAANTLAVMLR